MGDFGPAKRERIITIPEQVPDTMPDETPEEVPVEVPAAPAPELVPA